MANQPQDGTAQADYRLELPQSKFLTFDLAKISFREAQVRDDIYGLSRASHVFGSADPDFVAALKSAMGGANPLLKFRIGFGTPQNTYWLPWQEHIVTDFYASFEGIGTNAGHLVVIHSENNFARMRRSNRVLSRKGKISAMVGAIAKTAGLDSVIEETDGEFLLVQSFSDDVTFMLDRLVPRAVNKRGLGGYFCFIRDNVLHFHTLDYQTTARQVDYYSEVGCKLEARDLSQTAGLWNSGVGGVAIIAQDPATGASKEVMSDPAKAIKLEEGIYDFGSVDNGSINVPYHLSHNPVLELNALAQSAYQRARQQTFKNTLTLNKIISIRHGDLLNMLVGQQNAKSSDTSGYYFVSGTFYDIKKGEALSVYTLERGETQPQRGSTVTQDAENQLTPLSTAPGESPNIAAAQSSELTKGAGKRASAKTFTVVADAQTGQTS